MGCLEQVSFLHLMICFLLPVAVLLVILKVSRRQKLPFPPGPRPLPIIGNLLMMDQLTHRGLAKLAERFGGILYLRLGFRNNFVVSTPEMAQQVLQSQDSAFANRPATIAITYLTYNCSDMAFANYGPYWRQMRKLCVVKLFSRKRAESWASVREEIDATVLAVAARSATAVDVDQLMFSLAMRIIFRAAFGAFTDEGREEFIAVLQEFSKLFGAFNIGDFIPWLRWADVQRFNKRLRAAQVALDKFIDRIIDEHMANSKKADVDGDMVDDMIAFLDEAGGGHHEKDELHGSFRLTRNNIKGIIMDVMFGGTETVAASIQWAMAELMRNPEDMRRVQKELADVVGLGRQVCEGDLDNLPFLKCVIKETLRLHPPIPLLLHETAEDCEVAGYSIPARSRVMVNVWAICRAATAWKDPGEFRPERFAPGGEAAALDFKGSCFQFLPFGSGRRSCPGMQLGLLALELTVAQLAHCFSWALPGGMKPAELDMGDVFGLTAPRAVRLVAVPTTRLTCPLYEAMPPSFQYKRD